MAIYSAYHLNFRSPLHLGRQGIGLETTEVSIPADTLFSAICQTWRNFYGVESLTDFLELYKDAEPFLLTSAFPFAGDVRFFPKPLKRIEVPDEYRKKMKGIRFVSESRFRQIVSGEQIDFDPDHRINDGKIWVDAAECAAIPFLADAKNPMVWQTDMRPRVTIDRGSSASEIWHLGSVKFGDGCGLWFAGKFANEQVRTRIETLMRVLGDTGLGGERNAGYGLFHLEVKSVEIASEAEGDRFVTLSPICPQDAQALNGLLQGDVSYTLTERSGWISSSDANHLRRERVWMFTEGSVLTGGDQPLGCLVNLQPSQCPHPVWRYGYAWPVKMR